MSPTGLFHRLLLAGAAVMPGGAAMVASGPALTPSFAAPVLKWQRGGCTSFCQTGWYASPAVADLDNDGLPDVIWGSSDAVALNGAGGTLKWRGASGARVWPGVVVADIDGDGPLEVVVGRNSNQLNVYNAGGALRWTRNPFSGGEVRSLAVADLDNNGTLEIIVGRASGGATLQVSVYEPDGTVRPGWPALHSGTEGYGWGMYNENLAVADMNGDTVPEIFAPTDTHYIAAFTPAGNQLPISAAFAPRTLWAQQGVHVDLAADLRGYANCGTEHRPNFANVAPAVADVDGDGVPELVTAGNTYDCNIGNPDGDLYVLPWIFKLDHTRWSGGGFDWTVIPIPGPGSGPLSEDYTVIQNSVHNTVAADLDGDGRVEILVPSYDGKLHAWWLDKTEHGSWPYAVPGAGIHFAGEPVVVDLDNDGHAEVIFTSWGQNSAGENGNLHVLDYLGNPLYTVALPAPFGDTWNGGLAAPTIANIDADADLELVIGTWSSGVVAYDLPGSAGARILWGTGRGSQRRAGTVPARAPSESSSNSLRVSKATGTALTLKYNPSCGATQHTVFSGTSPIAGALNWTAAACALGTSGIATYDPGAGSPGALTYFVLVGQTTKKEGSYGKNTAGVERPEAVGIGACDRPRDLTGSCP